MPQGHPAIAVDLRDERPALAGRHPDERLLRPDKRLYDRRTRAALPVQKHKEPDLEMLDGFLLPLPIPNLLVLGHDEPASLSDCFEPYLIRGVRGEVIVHHLDEEAVLAQLGRDSLPPEVAVEEENGFRPVAHAASGSSNRIASLTSRGEHP